MSAPLSVQPLCRDEADDKKFCLFAWSCHEVRQRLQHHHGMRGADCWAYRLMQQDAHYPGEERKAMQDEPRPAA